MGNRFGRKREGPINGAETAATGQKPAEVPAATEPAPDSGITQTQEAVVTENLNAVVEEPVSAVTSPEDNASPAAPAPQKDSEPEPVVEETPAPVEPEPLVSVSEPSPPVPEPAEEPKPVAEPAPEPVPEPEPTSVPEVEVEALPEPIPDSEAAPAEAPEPQTDMLTEESLPEPQISSSPLIDLGVPDATPEPTNIPTSPDAIPAPVDADEPSDIPVTEECQDNAEVSVISSLEPEKSEETSESLEKPTEVEAPGDLVQLVSEVSEESVSELLQNLELKGNDLVADLIPADVKIPDDTPVTDTSMSAELMWSHGREFMKEVNGYFSVKTA